MGKSHGGSLAGTRSTVSCDVVDWVNACVGPLPVDVAHCRVNLAVVYGPETAEDFRHEWNRLSGDSYDPAWDLVTVLSWLPLEPYPPWRAASVTVSRGTMQPRLDALSRQSLHELGA